MDNNETTNIKKVSLQTVGNVGMFYACYRLSLAGWNAMPTVRNAKGPDIIIYSQDAQRMLSIQVKTLSKRAPVPLGKAPDIVADYVVVCNKVASGKSECFVLTPAEVCGLAHKGEKAGRVSYWLQPGEYENDSFRERWDRIGSGLTH